jgi:predicted DNA-binding WGR domain protein
MPTDIQNISGTYSASNPSTGIKIILTLNQNPNSIVAGKLILNNNDSYAIDGKVDVFDSEATLTGSISKGNEISFFEAFFEENQLLFKWVPVNTNAQPDYNSAVEVWFKKEHSAENINNRSENQLGNGYSDRQKDNYKRDPMLVGRWRNTDSYTSGDFTMVTEKYMQVRPDGTYSYGNGKVAGGGNSGSFNSGNGGDVVNGKWRTENSLLYIEEDYGQWVFYAGYYVEGNTLMFKFNNGSREIWTRM